MNFSELLSRKIPPSIFYTFTTHIDVIKTTTNTNLKKLGFRGCAVSSGILFGICWCLVADVSGKHVGPILKSQVVRICKLSQNFGNILLTNTAKYPSSNPRLLLCSLV